MVARHPAAVRRAAIVLAALGVAAVSAGVASWAATTGMSANVIASAAVVALLVVVMLLLVRATSDERGAAPGPARIPAGPAGGPTERPPVSVIATAIGMLLAALGTRVGARGKPGRRPSSRRRRSAASHWSTTSQH